jgi:hypothetical protein
LKKTTIRVFLHFLVLVEKLKNNIFITAMKLNNNASQFQ